MHVCGTPFEPALRSGAMAAGELADVARSLGAAGVEYRTVYWRDRERDVPAAAARANELGLTCTYASFAMLYDADPQNQDDLVRALDEAATLGSPLLRVFAGPGPVDAAARAAAERAVDAAAERAVVLAVENYVKVPGNTLNEVVAAGEPLNPDVVGVNVDLGNYAKNDHDPLACLITLLPRVVYCHFKDVRDVDGAPQVAGAPPRR